ncbi:MAG: hypothetical protein COS92_06645 [Desulfobacterales bacterium CG07_land_8_20_14_0_80_52_14]|nr:MAG: hypothetical protein COX20_10880 [Desulfobacterales bacterium CG23_combo_of_CG06-09_8_20_14_all_52_9]PIU49444.1 MAG: hypothetical protein COS92_06645 [Desulfobacterales bacterium CG07_land_8_20_14_0_80_52_14]
MSVRERRHRISDFRRKLYDHAITQSEKDVLKGTRWLLLNNPDEERNERQRLQDALELNQPSALKDYWIDRAHASNIPMLKQFANTHDRTSTASRPIMISPSPRTLWKTPTTKSEP